MDRHARWDALAALAKSQGASTVEANDFAFTYLHGPEEVTSAEASGFIKGHRYVIADAVASANRRDKS